MLSVGATESAAILEQSTSVFVHLKSFNAQTRESFGCGYDIVVPLIETIKGCIERASVVWKQQMIFLEPS